MNNKVVVTHPYRDFPAYKAGIKVGDEIISVNGQNTQSKTTAEVSTILKGQPQTEVEIEVRRYGQNNNLKFKIKRSRIKINSLAYVGMVGNDIGYLKLDEFTTNAGKEVGEALTRLKKDGARKIILDLRDNPGGLMHEAVNIVNLFVPKGMEVVSTKGKMEEWNKSYKTLGQPLDIEIPVVVLISEGSASASEIVAGALQDYDRAILVGSKTFGKGLVQTTRQLSYNSQLKVTTAKYYIPSGRCIQRLDYSHRKQDGTVGALADSLRTAFKTKSGRTVYDGGGLDPDIKIEQKYVGTITAALFNEGLIFEYATRYANENQPPANFKNFLIKDADYDKFMKWVKDQKFTYTTPLELEVNQLIEAGKTELFYNQIETDLKKLSAKIEENKAGDFIRFKPEIREILSRQIAFHYALNEGQVESSLANDQELDAAVKLLNEPSAYRKILTPQ
jgi:carboxyl-terminal processing protease